MKIGLLPGAFKPPHRGHYNIVQDLTYGGNFECVPYVLESARSAGMTVLRPVPEGRKSEAYLDKVYVIISENDRDGISFEQSLAIWNIYKKYLGDRVEIFHEGKDPVTAAKNIAKQNPDQDFYAIVGVRNLTDIPDLKRIGAYKNCPNVKGLAYSNWKSDIRGTFVREQISTMEKPNKGVFPSQLSEEDLKGIEVIIKEASIKGVEGLGELIKTEIEKNTGQKQLKEGSGGAPIQPSSAVKSSDRAKLLRVFKAIRNQLGDKFYRIEFKNDHITVALKGPSHPGSQDGDFDYTPYMGSILEYMIDQGHKIAPLPEITIKKDLVESQDFFGKTAYYDPNDKEVVLYIEGRHPKDVMRSFCHEMIHHIQNLEGRLTEVDTTDTNASEQLLELEKQAYLEGNLVFRTWEDKVKNEYNYSKGSS